MHHLLIVLIHGTWSRTKHLKENFSKSQPFFLFLFFYILIIEHSVRVWMLGEVTTATS